MKPHILVIDDSVSVRTAISRVLSNREYMLATVSNGGEGLASMEKQAYDLVLLDYSLPDMDGLQLLRKFVKKYPDIPVIMVTGSGSERLAVQALKSGASDYLVKTTDFISKLPHVVRDNLDKFDMRRRNRELEIQVRDSYKQLKQLNRELEAKVQTRTEELERAYQLSNELMAKAVDSNMQLAELYTEVDESRRKLETKIRELSLLNEVGKLMTSTPERDALLQLAVDSVHQELGVEHCAILLFDEHNARFTIGVSRGTPDDLLLAARSLPGEKVLFNILKEREPLLVQDVESVESFAPLGRDFPGVECFMLIPMYVKHHDIGIFTLYGFEHNETFIEADLQFVTSLAEHASIILANIFLTQQRIQEEQVAVLGKMMAYVEGNIQTFIETHESVSEQTSVRNIDRLLATIRELREFSSQHYGTLHLQSCPVSELIEQVAVELQLRFGDQKMEIAQRLEYTGDVCIDIEKMKHVFINLADNACQAMPEGGIFTITSRLEKNVVQFECIDEGYGISPDLLSRIFEPFFSEGNASGPGLGLTIVKKILDEHHAHVKIFSVISKGTTVNISLPLTQ